jgi:hypothetical protein
MKRRLHAGANRDNREIILRLSLCPPVKSVCTHYAGGCFEKNGASAYSFNNITAKPDSDGSITIHFGRDPRLSNYIPIVKGWNCTPRLYRPRKEILDGT